MTAQAYPNLHNPRSKSFDYLLKIIIIGDSSVGKSSLMTVFSGEKFSVSHITTIGIDFKIKTIQIGDKKIKFQIWDTAGQERFRNITRQYYKNAHGIFVIYDISNEISFNNISYWLSSIRTYGDDNAKIILIGNKNDLEDQRTVSKVRGQELADEYDIQFFETSAKNISNVDAMFSDMAIKVIEKNKDIYGVKHVIVMPVLDVERRCC